MFSYRKNMYIKQNCKYEDAACRIGRTWRECNMLEINIEIKGGDEFSEGLNIFKEREGNNDDVPVEGSSNASGKDRYEYV